MHETRHGADVAGLVEPEGSGDFEATKSFFLSFSLDSWLLENMVARNPLRTNIQTNFELVIFL